MARALAVGVVVVVLGCGARDERARAKPTEPVRAPAGDAASTGDAAATNARKRSPAAPTHELVARGGPPAAAPLPDGMVEDLVEMSVTGGR